jgi:hypothetical protein
MFVQVIQGYVDDPAPIANALETWVRDVAPGAIGWLGSTAGVTDDGRFIALARFESAEAAQRNSDQLFSKEVTFSDSSDVELHMNGNPDQAGFVQVMQGRGSNSERARELMKQNADEWAAFRPEVLGQLQVAQPGDLWTMAIYFTSEQAAREGEAKELPPNLQAEMDEMNQLMQGVPEFFDLKDPWLHSPS